jgi:hypothetical protein
VSSAESAPKCGDLDEDFEPAKRKKMLRRHRAAMSYTRKKTWINGSSNNSQSIKKGEVCLCINLTKYEHLYPTVDSTGNAQTCSVAQGSKVQQKLL